MIYLENAATTIPKPTTEHNSELRPLNYLSKKVVKVRLIVVNKEDYINLEVRFSFFHMEVNVMSYNKKIYVITDSKHNLYKFYLNNKNLILKSSHIGEIIIKKNILEYSVYIDKNDKIHIAYIDKGGQLNYCSYFENKLKEKSILSISEEYLLRMINIIVISSKIHIFYQVYNIKKNIISIYHNYYYEGEWVDEKIAEPCCSQYVSAYDLDCCGELIYMIYPKNYALGEYSIKIYDSNKNHWEYFENTFAIKKSVNLDIFVTPNKILIISFSKFVRSNLQAMIIYKNLNLPNSSWSREKNISNNNINTFKPTLFYKNNSLYVLWQQGNSIVYRRSKDLLNWSNIFVLEVMAENKHELLYFSNDNKDKSFKIKHIYLSYSRFLYFILKCSGKGYYNKKSVTYINKLLEQIELKDKRNRYTDELNLNLTGKIEELRDLVNKYEDNLENIKIEQALVKQKCYEIIYQYENEIKVLEEDKNKLFLNMTNKIDKLMKIIEEKEDIIKRLQESNKRER